jgi:hypothetical protein
MIRLIMYFFPPSFYLFIIIIIIIIYCIFSSYIVPRFPCVEAKLNFQSMLQLLNIAAYISSLWV